MKGQIRQSLSGYYDVVTADGAEYRTRARGVFRKRKQSPLVGDWVEFKVEKDGGYLLKIDPRKNRLVRPPIANVDDAIVVSACIEPDFSSNLLDRQLIMLAANQIDPLLYFSKWDLLAQNQQATMQPVIDYYQKYYPVEVACNGAPQKFLRDLQNQVIVVMGQTGAGKSTLLNQLNPDLKLETGEISKALSRGKHTTRKVTLMEIEHNLIADTPGFSSFDLLEISKEELPNYYPDFVAYRDQCKYRGCMHVNEPHCAVKEAVANGEILKSRYENYLQFHQMILERKPRY